MGHHCQFCWKCISLLNNYRSYIFTFLCLLLSTHDYRQGVGISFTVCFVCVCVFVRLRISPTRIKLAASNFARQFIGVQGRESHIFMNFAPHRRPKWNELASAPVPPRLHNDYPLAPEHMTACGVSACVVIRRSRWTYLFFVFTSVCFQVLPWQRNECMLFWYLCKVLLSFTEQKTL